MTLLNKKIIFSILFFILLFSCKKNYIDVEYYKESNKKYKITYNFKNYDSVVYYYKNGKIFTTGLKDKKGNLFGNWNYYNTDGFLSETRELFIVGNDFKLNQLWYFNKKGDTIVYPNKKFNTYNQKEFESSLVSNTSIFMWLSFTPKKDTIKILEKIEVNIQDATPFWSNKNSEEYLILADQKHNFNSNFSNVNKVKVDTIRNLYNIKENLKYKKDVDLKHTVSFTLSFKTPGKKTLRGYVVEFYKNNKTDKKNELERRTYFEKIIYVK